MAKQESARYEWMGDYLTVQEIADKHDVRYATAYGWTHAGHTTIETIIGGGKIKRPRKGKQANIVAARPKVERKIVRVNENCLVRIQLPELDSMLQYLAKGAKVTYQAAFNEFVRYIFEGRMWNRHDNHEAIAMLKARLAKHGSNGNGHVESEEYSEYMPKETGKSRVAELLEPYILELEEKVSNLTARNVQLENIIRTLRNAMKGLDE